MSKPLIILYEGIPGSGKTTLMKAVNKVRDYRDIALDRFTPTQWVYDSLRGRLFNESLIVERGILEHFEVWVVYCICPPELAYERCKAKNDDDDANLEKLIDLNRLYKRYFTHITQFENIVLVNTMDSIEENVADVIETIG